MTNFERKLTRTTRKKRVNVSEGRQLAKEERGGAKTRMSKKPAK